ncbi:hypothetical protein DM01DRAFT_1129420 [Hesseltinella vesiculosa]|uniref:Uncharacterized protein n=1 Tax=Hesseltinella vesiculosa TaxID=101127 RepID=A0A1X2GUS0_9FUNG|nr:hypothetical protein DM01DRAFT_1129420 [Hesseltinella vesiculosa]
MVHAGSHLAGRLRLFFFLAGRQGKDINSIMHSINDSRQLWVSNLPSLVKVFQLLYLIAGDHEVNELHQPMSIISCFAGKIPKATRPLNLSVLGSQK